MRANEVAMRTVVRYGRKAIDLEVDAGRLIGGARPHDPGVSDAAAAVRAALDAPYEYPPLRRALTPDDHVTVVLDEHLPNLATLLVPVLEHLVTAGVKPSAVTLLCSPSQTGQPWVDDLPDEFEEVRVEIHDPCDRKRLRYLATTKVGRRLYLNQSVVDADLVVVLSGRGYDAVLGYGGAEGAIYPALADEATCAEVAGQARLKGPGGQPWPPRQEAIETSWLLGAPFFVQVIEGSGDGVAQVVAGSVDASAEGCRRQDARWAHRVASMADLVVAGISGDPARHTFADLAAAAACAARVVRADGRIVLLSEVATAPGPEFDVLRASDDPSDAANRLGRKPAPEQLAAARWATAAAHARLTVLCALPDETIEELSATPLQSAIQAQRLLDAGGTCLFLDDAHKALASVDPSEPGE